MASPYTHGFIGSTFFHKVANIIRSMVYKVYIDIYTKNRKQITRVAAQSVLKRSKKERKIESRSDVRETPQEGNL